MIFNPDQREFWFPFSIVWSEKVFFSVYKYANYIIILQDTYNLINFQISVKQQQWDVNLETFSFQKVVGKTWIWLNNSTANWNR